jgi:chromosome segregation ATPase
MRWRGKVEGIVHERARLARERETALNALHEQEDRLRALKTAHQFRELELLVIRLAEIKMPASRAGTRIRAAEKAIAETQAQLDQLRPELDRTEEQIQQVKRSRVKRRLM